MGMFQRLVDRAAVNDEFIDEDFEDEYEGDVLDEDDVEETIGEIAEIRPVGRRTQNEDLARIVTLWPRVFSDVQEFADYFRDGVPVILNLSHAEEDVRYRIVDFASGVCYGLRGQPNQISDDVLLLTPATVTLESPRALHERF